jgi:hypothetical protein
MHLELQYRSINPFQEFDHESHTIIIICEQNITPNRRVNLITDERIQRIIVVVEAVQIGPQHRARFSEAPIPGDLELPRVSIFLLRIHLYADKTKTL